MKERRDTPENPSSLESHEQTIQLEKQDAENNQYPKIYPKRRSKRKVLKKIVKEGSNFTLLKVSATALTAVSMALISTKLTTLVNSLTLVALVSVGSAVFSEFYRVALSVTSLGAKKVIAPIIQINPDGTTTEIPIVKQAEVEEPKTKGFIASVKRYFKRNPFMKMTLLFTVISAVTIASSYYAAGFKEPQSVNNFTAVTKQTTKEISDTEKQKIIDSAVNSSNANSAAQVTEMKRLISNLTYENSNLKKSLEDLTKEQNSTSENMKKLAEKLSDLDKKLQSDSKSKTDSSETPKETASPSTSPTPESSKLDKTDIDSTFKNTSNNSDDSQNSVNLDEISGNSGLTAS